MNYLDFFSLLEGEPAILALLSTFQFDPDFFERRLLKCPALKKARRIAVFMDARQWHLLLQRDVPTRRMNRDYLVVPVRRTQGVFHPKLNVLVTETGGQVLCGSNNLTRSGCSSNLELLNSLPFEFESKEATGPHLAKQVLAFFRRASDDTDEQVARIVQEWIAEIEKWCPWPKDDGRTHLRDARLVHTYDGPIWEQIKDDVGGSQPQQFFIASPFHDADGSICQDLSKLWPNAEVELLVQQGYTTLPVNPLRKLPFFRLAEIQDASRRVHAKLFAWKGQNSSGCFVGSANFTSAAFNGRNVEAGLILKNSWPLVEKLFDSKLKKRPLSLDDFQPGKEVAPEMEDWIPPLLSISSAVLVDDTLLLITFQNRLEESPTFLRLTIRTPGEQNPRVSIPIPKTSQGKEKVGLPEGKLSDAHGTLLATIVAEIEGKRLESPPVWIVQEDRLTHEPGDGSASSRGKVRETGEGLPEYLDELGSREGAAAIADFLRQLDIAYYDGSSGGRGAHRFRVRITDPFESDKMPDWLIQAKTEADDLGEAILDFVERHHKRKLVKHASRGNINGIENFLDILTTLVRLLYIYSKRSVVVGGVKRDIVMRGVLIGWLCTWIELTTIGRDTDAEYFDGYLSSLWESLGGDVATLRKFCEANHYGAEIRAILLLAQKIRYIPGEIPQFDKPPKSQKDVLKRQATIVTKGMSDYKLTEPTNEEVRQALERYNMFTPAEISGMVAEL
jgi:hypothetical protein